MPKRPRGPFSLHLPLDVIERLRKSARFHGTTQSSLARLALMRGLVSLEMEADLSVTPQTEPPQRRRILSPGVR